MLLLKLIRKLSFTLRWQRLATLNLAAEHLPFQILLCYLLPHKPRCPNLLFHMLYMCIVFLRPVKYVCLNYVVQVYYETLHMAAIMLQDQCDSAQCLALQFFAIFMLNNSEAHQYSLPQPLQPQECALLLFLVLNGHDDFAYVHKLYSFYIVSILQIHRVSQSFVCRADTGWLQCISTQVFLWAKMIDPSVFL